VYAPPLNQGQVLRIDCHRKAVSLIGDEIWSNGGASYAISLLGPDGCIYCPPLNAERVLRITPEQGGIVELIGPEELDLCGSHKWQAAVVGSDKRIYAIPCNAMRVLRIDTESGVVDLIGPRFKETQKFRCAVATQDGRIYAPPWNFRFSLCVDCATGTVAKLGDKLEVREKRYRAIALGPDGKQERHFEPGQPGFKFDEGGLVTAVDESGPAHALGIQVGWRVIEVDEEPYTEALLNKNIFGREGFTLVFKDRPPHIWAVPYSACQLFDIDTKNGKDTVFHGEEGPPFEGVRLPDSDDEVSEEDEETVQEILDRHGALKFDTDPVLIELKKRLAK
jgi:hypothetical protein